MKTQSKTSIGMHRYGTRISNGLKKDVFIQKYFPVFLRKWFANLNYYFWLPCPKCKVEVGGFECANSETIMNTEPVIINSDTNNDNKTNGNVVEVTMSRGKMVCPCCSLKIIELKNGNFKP
jgi:hypothetical protein